MKIDFDFIKVISECSFLFNLLFLAFRGDVKASANHCEKGENDSQIDNPSLFSATKSGLCLSLHRSMDDSCINTSSNKDNQRCELLTGDEQHRSEGERVAKADSNLCFVREKFLLVRHRVSELVHE